MRKPTWMRWVLLIALIGAASCGDDGESARIVQFSTISALEQGQLDVVVERAELAAHGDLGLGAFEGLDGEMILFDGVLYQGRVDGSVVIAPSLGMTFATAVDFEPDLSIEVGPGTDFSGLGAAIDAAVPDLDVPCAIRITGDFAEIRIRSVPGQEKPYPTLAEVVAQQVTFDLYDISGGLAGFRLPSSVQGTNVTGYHFHFVSSDASAAGHVLKLDASALHVEVDLRDEVAVLRRAAS